MNDIVARLRDSVRACRALDRSALLEEAATMIERLRMTPAEREAVLFAARRLEIAYTEERAVAATLRGLLQRLE